MTSSPIQQITAAYQEGYAALFLSGRSLHDLVIDGPDMKMRTLVEALRRELRESFGLVLLTYSLSSGLDWDRVRIADEQDQRTVERVLKAHGLLQIPQDENEAARVIRGLSSLLRASPKELKWSAGRDMRFAALLEFGEHLTPGGLLNGTQTDNQIISIELAHTLAQSLALRSSGNLLMFHGRDGLIDELVKGALHRVHIRQPDEAEKRQFYETVKAFYALASLEDDLTFDAVARMTVNTPNRSLESLLRASDRSGRTITAKELAAQKNRDVEMISEGTVRVLDTARVSDVNLCGVNIAIPKRVLERYAAGLLKGDRTIPANVMLVGPPGTAKTDLAILMARNAKVSAYQIDSPKGGFVGETERKVRLQWSALSEWTPNCAFIDEITEAMPLERGNFDGDSGASRAVTAQLLTVLADESRRGKSLLIATTNCPWRMGAAMRGRFVLLPVLFPLRADFPSIIIATANRITPSARMDIADPKIVEASNLFYEKGASPRHIRSQLSITLSYRGVMDADTSLFAAEDFCATTDRVATIYTELWAIKACSSNSFLPWSADPASYPYPEHLKGIVDGTTGRVNRDELEKRLQEYQPYVNV
ncbi:MAG TPA: AAA family ATPase [Blastocatellia bacterium]|nr:AAA family ATPase [Blastocatellia bacterium]